MKRNHQLDFFRGLLILIITIDHFFSPESLVRKVTDGFIGWVSAAGGFVLISGLTAGLVYTYKANKKGYEHVRSSIIQRVLSIYKYHLGLFLFIMLILTFDSPWKSFWQRDFQAVLEAPLTSLINCLALLYEPKYLDILPMYAIFLLFVPTVVKLFEKKKYVQVLGVSALLYLLGCLNIFAVPESLANVQAIKFGSFNLCCWQILFTIGLLLGHLMYHDKIDLQKWQKFILPVLLIVVICFITKKAVSDDYDGPVNYLGRKDRLMPLRLINVLSIAFLLAIVSSKYKKIFSFKPICYLGKHSLELFSLHILTILLLKPFTPYFNTMYYIRLNSSTFIYPITNLVLLFGMIPLFYSVIYLKEKINSRLPSAK